MFRSLRNRLIFSHIFLFLAIIPPMGIAMLYLLESRILLPMIYTNLSEDAALIAEVAQVVPDIWVNPASTQIFVQGADVYLGGRLTLTDPSGYVLASADPDDSSEVVELPDMSGVNQGEVVQIWNGPLAEVFAPVLRGDGRLLGVVRLTTRPVTVSDEIYQLRYLLAGVLLLAILAGIGLGSYLAVTISRPVRQATEAITTLAQGEMRTRLPEKGTDEMRTLARAVNTLVQRLLGMEQARRQLLANLVHEIGTPLGAVRSAIHALQNGADQDPELEADLLDGLDSETGRLQRLLDDLAGMYDQVLGPLELNRKRIELKNWLADVLVPWEVSAREKGLAWQADLPEDLPEVAADPDRLAQAIGNLCSNAIKFTPAEGLVSVSAGVEAGRVWVRISDTGPGIPTEEQGKVFHPFFRGSQKRRIRQGMGLGLAIAHDIILAHGGEIRLESEEGAGASFTIWLVNT